MDREGLRHGYAALSRGPEQITVRASRRLSPTPELTSVGPIHYEVVEPMRAVRFRLDPNDCQPIAFDWLFRVELPPVAEDRTHLRAGYRTEAELVRYHQIGAVEGWIKLDGERIADCRLTDRRSGAKRPGGRSADRALDPGARSGKVGKDPACSVGGGARRVRTDAGLLVSTVARSAVAQQSPRHYGRRVFALFVSALRRPVGLVHWAGTETSPVWSSTAEGTIRCGERAAAEVLDRL